MRQRLAQEQANDLRARAKRVLPARLIDLVNTTGINYNMARDGVRLGHMRTRWGSRSSNNTISLNIGLVGLPEPLIDYVILHELTHIHHMNHSKSFYAELATYDPCYRQHQAALRRYHP